MPSPTEKALVLIYDAVLCWSVSKTAHVILLATACVHCIFIIPYNCRIAECLRVVFISEFVSNNNLFISPCALTFSTEPIAVVLRWMAKKLTRLYFARAVSLF